MTMTEKSNMAEGLRAVNFTDTQATDLRLMIEGQITIEEWKKRFEEEEKKKK